MMKKNVFAGLVLCVVCACTYMTGMSLSAQEEKVTGEFESDLASASGGISKKRDVVYYELKSAEEVIGQAELYDSIIANIVSSYDYLQADYIRPDEKIQWSYEELLMARTKIDTLLRSICLPDNTREVYGQGMDLQSYGIINQNDPGKFIEIFKKSIVGNNLNSRLYFTPDYVLSLLLVNDKKNAIAVIEDYLKEVQDDKILYLTARKENGYERFLYYIDKYQVFREVLSECLGEDKYRDLVAESKNLVDDQHLHLLYPPYLYYFNPGISDVTMSRIMRSVRKASE